MNEEQSKLFYLINDNGYDMEYLIEKIPYNVTKNLIVIFEELIEEEQEEIPKPLCFGTGECRECAICGACFFYKECQEELKKKTEEKKQNGTNNKVKYL